MFDIIKENGTISYLSAKVALIFRVLSDFDLLNHFSQRSTITGTVLAHGSDLLGALGLKFYKTMLSDIQGNILAKRPDST